MNDEQEELLRNLRTRVENARKQSRFSVEIDATDLETLLDMASKAKLDDAQTFRLELASAITDFLQKFYPSSTVVMTTEKITLTHPSLGKYSVGVHKSRSR